MEKEKKSIKFLIDSLRELEFKIDNNYFENIEIDYQLNNIGIKEEIPENDYEYKEYSDDGSRELIIKIKTQGKEEHRDNRQ